MFIPPNSSSASASTRRGRGVSSRGAWSTLATSALVGVLVAGSVALLTGTGWGAPSADAADSSAVTVTAARQDPDAANAPMPDLRVTVSQTKDLLAQGITVSWTGGKRSVVPSAQTGGENFLQIMQCWGDDPANPGQPDRTTCQYGGFKGPGAARDGNREEGSVAPQDGDFTYVGSGPFDPTYTSIPFRAVDGTVVRSVDENRAYVPGVDMGTNPYFTALTTNEIAWGGSGATGEGSARFELQTVTQASGLGCGAPITASDGTVSGRPCWLVVVPRGTADTGRSTLVDSGLFWDAWKHKLAVKLDFRPVGVRCAIGAAERKLAGSEPVAEAVASWQPALCSQQGGAAYSMITGSESDAARMANAGGTAPLALTSRALETDTKDSLVYAPVALTGAAVTFAIDREPNPITPVPQEVAARAHLPFEKLNLTPRLVAKLLTGSYLDSLPTYADKKHLGFVDGEHPGRNAENVTSDPDFLAVNDPEWGYQSLTSPALADMLVPQGRSDLAYALWQYVLADPEAAAFVAGTPDPWGMIVNPYSSTDAAKNPTGAPLELPREDFPKADPTERTDPVYGGPVNVVTWRPYTTDFAASAYRVLRGDGQILGPWDALGATPKYGKTPRALPGDQKVLGLTDTASASRYTLLTAALRNPAGQFVTPTDESLLAAAAAMTATPNGQVYRFDPASAEAKAATGAYPLTMPVYAAANPATLDPGLRTDYSRFIEYAVGTGQRPGDSEGMLPGGYVPLPEGWRTQALTAAAAIRAGVALPSRTTTTAGSTTTGSTRAGSSSLGGLSTLALGADGGAATDPAATGTAAGALLGKPTAADPATPLAPSIPVSILSGLACALAVPFVSRRKRLQPL